MNENRYCAFGRELQETNKEQTMDAIDSERRLHPRIDINGDMNYRLDHCDVVRAGQLENLSEGGARIWIDEVLPAATRVVFRMESDAQGEADMTFSAVLLHRLPQRKSSRYGYGCVIEASTEEW